MRRFVTSYLTISVIIISLANLILTLIYVRQLGLQAQALTDCLPGDCQTVGGRGDFIVINGVLIGLLLVIWFTVIKFRFHRSPN